MVDLTELSSSSRRDQLPDKGERVEVQSPYESHTRIGLRRGWRVAVTMGICLRSWRIFWMHDLPERLGPACLR